MSYNRIVLISLVIGFAALMSYNGWDNGDNIIVPIAIGGGIHIVIGLILFAHILWKPGVCPPRRIIAMVTDLSSVTLSIHYGGEWCLWQYPLLLWITFGNGFRFGVRYLFAASAISVAGFAFLLSFSPFWQRYPALSWGCLTGLIILPAYVSVLIRKLNDSIELAEQANRAKSMFLASVSHELRTPLNAIIGLSDLMKATRLNAEQTDMSQTIGDAGRTLLSLINSVLDLSRLEVGKMPFVLERLDLFALLNRIHRITSVIAENKGLKTYLQIAPDVPQFILASTRQLEEIITNLMSNAVKFTEKGHVLVRVRMQTVDDERVSLSFEIEDTGIGLADEAKSTIFESFMQADETIVNRFGGTGLGLAIVKQMVEQGGGTVEVDSTLGVGSTFTVSMAFDRIADTSPIVLDGRSVLLLSQNDDLEKAIAQFVPDLAVLRSPTHARSVLNQTAFSERRKPVIFIDLDCPGDIVILTDIISDERHSFASSRLIGIARPESIPDDADLGKYFTTLLFQPITSALIENALRIAASDHGGESGPVDVFAARTKGRILVADDNKTNQKVIGKILARAGHSVEFADNGQIAVEKLESGSFDLAFMDVNMPVLSGIEAVKLYRLANAGASPIPIFALTADVTEATSARCREAGMVGVLGKPIEAAALLSVVDNQINAAGGTVLSEHDESGTDNIEHASNDQESAEEGDGAAYGPIDTAALADLAELGGPDFVREVVDQFVDDALGILVGINRAVENQDYRAFRDELHALRSGAANVGAIEVFQSCLRWREIAPEELTASGDEYLRMLQGQLTDAREQLRLHIERETGAGTPQLPAAQSA